MTLRTMTVFSDRHHFKCRVGHGLVTVNPSHEFSSREGFLADERVPVDIAVVMRGRGLRLLYLPTIAATFPQQDLAEVLRAGRLPWEKSPPPDRSVTVLLDHCNWPKRGPAWRIYPVGRFVAMFEKERVSCRCWPAGLRFLEFPEEGQAQYVLHKLKLGRFPDLPPESLITYDGV